MFAHLAVEPITVKGVNPIPLAALVDMRKNPLHAPEISKLVARQSGHITRRQLLAAGFSEAWIERHVLSGELIPVHAGVYAVGHVPRHAHARAWAALLACGADAALSHDTAAALWGAGGWPALLEVTSHRERRRPGIWTHRSTTLRHGDIRTQLGLRVTSPARTVLDLQSRLTDARLCRTVDDLRAAGHLGPTGFADLCARSARVRRLLGDIEGFTRSQLEQSLRTFLIERGLPLPAFSAHLPESGREVDALYSSARLIIELGSWERHRNRASFERDREKDERAVDDGYDTIRITHRRLAENGDTTAARLRRILSRANQGD